MTAAAHARLEALAFSDLPGWRDDTLEAAWAPLRASAKAILSGAPPLRNALPPDASGHRAHHRAMQAAMTCPANGVRRFLETHFTPHRVAPAGAGFVTAYYEPRVAGALERSAEYAAPILARPRDLAGRGDALYPDRRAILSGAIDAQTNAIVWLRDAVEVFLVQVQGSARVTLADGGELRLVYDGRNGRPYTSIGRRLVETGAIAPETMSLAVLKGWLRANGAGTGGPADAVMNANESYVFFRAAPVEDPSAGPIGGQGVPLTPLRSMAIDRTIWSYGLPFWVDAPLPDGPFRRLMIAQDTGSAIVGPARADLFFGSGEAAGARAGLVRHAADLFVLLPDAAPRERGAR